MAEVIEGQGTEGIETSGVEGTETIIGQPKGLIDIQLNGEKVEGGEEKPVEGEKKPTEGEEKPLEGGEEEFTALGEDDMVDIEKTLEKFGDLMDEEDLKEIIGEFNDGKMSGKDLIKTVLNEIGKDKDKLEKELDGEIDAVKKDFEDNPMEGIVLAELTGWVESQGKEMIEMASILTDFSLGSEAVRSAIKLLNKVRMGSDGVADPDVNVVQKVTVGKDSLREEYMNIYQTKTGNERTIGIANLIKKAEKTGDKDLLDWANGMFG